MSNLEKRPVTPPATEPVSVEEAKLHCRIDHSAEDALLAGLIMAARMHVENECNLALLTQSWEVLLDAWPRTLLLPQAPVSAVTGVTYTDENGVTAVLAATAYTVRTGLCPAQVIFNRDALPSVTLADVGGIVVRYVAGYGAAAASVPMPIRQAMLLLIGDWYKNREAENAGPLPMAVDALLEPYRMRWMGPWVVG